jgi:hypothetical protein
VIKYPDGTEREGLWENDKRVSLDYEADVLETTIKKEKKRFE